MPGYQFYSIFPDITKIEEFKNKEGEKCDEHLFRNNTKYSSNNAAHSNKP